MHPARAEAQDERLPAAATRAGPDEVAADCHPYQDTKVNSIGFKSHIVAAASAVYLEILPWRIGDEFRTTDQLIDLLLGVRFHTFTSTTLVVSLPKMSITLTAILYRPFFSYSCLALVSSSVRSLRVR